MCVSRWRMMSLAACVQKERFIQNHFRHFEISRMPKQQQQNESIESMKSYVCADWKWGNFAANQHTQTSSNRLFHNFCPIEYREHNLCIDCNQWIILHQCYSIPNLNELGVGVLLCDCRYAVAVGAAYFLLLSSSSLVPLYVWNSNFYVTHLIQSDNELFNRKSGT